jgi:galactokinase
MTIKERLRQYHRQLFGREELIIASPGRVNIIGEHTDYNKGLVLPYALDKHIFMAASPIETGLKVYSGDQKRYVDFALNEGHPSWTKYYIQVTKYLKDHYGPLPGLAVTMLSDLPLGAGISSSSALTCGIIFLYDHFMDLSLTVEKMIEIATYTEHGIGVIGGAMDQSTILKAKKNYALLMDFGKKEEQYIQLAMDQYEWFLIYSDVEHSLVDSEYNTRRRECEESTHLISKSYRPINHLSELNIADLKHIHLPDKLMRRTQFVVKENQRVRDAVKSLLQKDFDHLGELINSSHDGLSGEYEVSTSEIDWLVDRLRDQDKIIGARMIGGGFGGSILVLSEKGEDNGLEHVVKEYNDKHLKEAFFFNAHSGPAIKKYDI